MHGLQSNSTDYQNIPGYSEVNSPQHATNSPLHRLNWTLDRKLELLFAGAIVLLTFGLAVVSYLQWDSMNGQLAEMQSASKQTDELINETRRFATSMESVVLQNRAILEHNIETSRLEQRAWIGISTVDLLPIEADRALKVRGTVVNTGRTPALNVIVKATLTRVPSKDSPLSEFKAARDRSIPGGNIVPPNGGFQISINSHDLVTKQEIDNIDIGKRSVYFYAYVNYDDVFKRKHFLEICSVYDPITRSMFHCAGFNRMDENNTGKHQSD